ncbi:LacI family DNA-binding transcriptional regulator [Acrocarpospora catenulata]|uniref:LacI family DNA-binding transcriptional regulator n=1 Tax=Acrocarpospora catenulata TaxID=2836182 RepID=UPI001BD95358|nr:LacI family DNA-binding transcriptional regulator [Acrocarpospora catenulata]
MGVTLIDVAKAAGVSRSTVSRALSDGTGYVDPETRERVRNVARRLGYQPNLIARGLRVQRVAAVGVIVKDLLSHTTLRMIESLQDRLNQAGYQVYLCLTKDRPDLERGYLDTLLASRVSGLVVATSGDNESRYAQAMSSGVAIASVIRDAPVTGVREFFVDERESARAATEYLLNLGHRRVAIVVGESRSRSAELRLAGYRDAFASANVELDDRLVFRGRFAAETGHAAIATFIGLPHKPTALLIANDEATEGVVAACVHNGIAIPGDLSLISYEDSSLVRNWSPRISAINTNPELIGSAVADYLVGAAQEKNDEAGEPTKTTLFPSILIHRESCRILPSIS